MSRIERFRSAGGRPVFFAAILGVAGLSLATAYGCTAGGEVEPPDDEDEDDKELPGDRDAGGDPIVDDELTAAIAPIDDGHLESLFTLDGSTSVTSGRAVDFLWEVEAPEGAGCEGSIVNPSAPVTSFTPACRGPHTVTLTVSFPDDSKSSQAEATFSVENRVPVLSALTTDGAFLPGEAVTISATVTDEDDEDVPTCTARLADDSPGDPTGLVIPSEPSADCSFTITTPPRVDTWKVVVVANDGFDDSLPASIELKAGNDPPVITGVDTDEASVAYACAEGACAADTVRVSVEATDDSDDFEELTIELVDVTESAPDGVTVTVNPVTGSPGEYDVVVSREDLGPLADTYTLEARVTEVTGGEDGPATVTQQVSFEVSNQAPVLDEVTADDVAHAYASGSYTATLTVTATASDPEENALTTTIALVSCPKAAVGEEACGGAGLSIEETAADGSLVLELEANSLANLAGEYGFSVTTTDAEGASITQDATLVVTNVAPTVAPGFQASQEQSYTGSVHTAQTPLLADADEDPVTVTLTITCPDDTIVTPPSGSCGTGQTVSLDPATGILKVSGPADGLLGGYVVAGTATDGASTANINRTFTITNSAPDVVRTSNATVTCDHRTTSGTVKNEAGCDFVFKGNTSDPNGDPLTYTVTLTSPTGYSRTGAPISDAAVPANEKIEFVSGIETSWANFKSTFDNQKQRITVVVSDPFDKTASSGMNPRLKNRAPALVDAAFRNTSNTGNPPKLPNDEYSTGTARDTYHYLCSEIACGSHAPPYRFALRVDALDPDGDPVEVSLGLDCSNPVVHGSGGAVTTYRPIPANKLIPLEMRGTVEQCAGTSWYREWNVSLLPQPISPCDMSGPLPICFEFLPRITCTADAATSRVRDGISSATFGESVAFQSTLTTTTNPITCN